MQYKFVESIPPCNSTLVIDLVHACLIPSLVQQFKVYMHELGKESLYFEECVLAQMFYIYIL